MSDEINAIIRKNKEKREKYVDNSNNKNNNLSKNLKYIKSLLSRSLVTLIFVLGSIIFTNISDDFKKLYQEVVLENSLEFMKINQFYEKIFGKVDITKKESDTTMVFQDITYTNIEPFKNGAKLTVGGREVVNVITSGIIVFIGDKDDLGNTIIIQGNDGVDIWYSNITDNDIKVYDYIEKGSILGTSNSEYIYITISKDGKFLTYEEYMASI